MRRRLGYDGLGCFTIVWCWGRCRGRLRLEFWFCGGGVGLLLWFVRRVIWICDVLVCGRLVVVWWRLLLWLLIMIVAMVRIGLDYRRFSHLVLLVWRLVLLVLLEMLMLYLRLWRCVRWVVVVRWLVGWLRDVFELIMINLILGVLFWLVLAPADCWVLLRRFVWLNWLRGLRTEWLSWVLGWWGSWLWLWYCWLGFVLVSAGVVGRVWMLLERCIGLVLGLSLTLCLLWFSLLTGPISMAAGDVSELVA